MENAKKIFVCTLFLCIYTFFHSFDGTANTYNVRNISIQSVVNPFLIFFTFHVFETVLFSPCKYTIFNISNDFAVQTQKLLTIFLKMCFFASKIAPNFCLVSKLNLVNNKPDHHFRILDQKLPWSPPSGHARTEKPKKIGAQIPLKTQHFTL
jgi:hypothetical protein